MEFLGGGGELNLELEYFMDKHNMALAMLPPPFTQEEVDTITKDELWDKSRDRSLRQQLMKETVSLLMNGESEYLILDFYDFHNYIFSYKDTAFCTQANEFCATSLFRKYANDLQVYNLLELPKWILYGMVDRFFNTIMQKFDSNHIILNRFWTNSLMLYVDGSIIPVPEESKKAFQCHEKYNVACYELEEHVIQKYNPYVIDVSKYFIGDANFWNNYNASHFEKEFYRVTYDQILRIIKGEASERYYDKCRFFDYSRDGFQDDMQRKFDVEWGIDIFNMLLDNNNVLWINILDKLNAYAPDDDRVKGYMQALNAIL